MRLFYACLVGILMVVACSPSESPPDQTGSESFGLVWLKTYGGSLGDVLESGTVDGDGYVLVGRTASGDGDVDENRGWEDAWVLKIDEDGEVVESRTYGGGGFDGLVGILKVEGGYVLAGYSSSSDGDLDECLGYEDVWIFELEDFGIVWSSKIAGRLADKPTGILRIEDGYLVYGYTDSYDGDFKESHGFQDAWISKIDEDGNVEWTRMYGGSKLDGFEKVLKTDGGFLVVGTTASSEVNAGIEETDVWVLKIDDAGNVVWQESFGGNGWQAGVDVVEDDEGYVILARTIPEDGEGVSFDVWIFKIDGEGNTVWSHTYGGSFEDFPERIFKEDDGYLVVARSRSTDGDVGGSGNYDVWVFKIGKDGEILKSAVFDSGSDDVVLDAFLEEGYILVVGTSGEDGMVMKISR